VKKVQLYVDERKDEVVYGLIDRLEVEANGTRGFVSDQIKERLKAFEMLCKRIGTNDPMEVLMKYVEGTSQGLVLEQPSVPQEIVENSPSNSALPNKFVDAAKNNFDFD
jgi:hypothetical protein